MHVLVLRPEGPARASAARLEGAGHTPLVAPVLSIEPTGAQPPPGPFGAVLVTSVNAVPALLSLQRHAALPVFAVGGRTDAALARGGLSEVASAPDAASLARLAAERLAPARLLLVAGRDRKPEPEASLSKAGFEIAVWEAYRAVAAGELTTAARNALSRGTLDAALHYSRRSAETALGLVRAAGLERDFAALRHLCLSDDVAEGLGGLGGAEIRVAARPDEDALLALLDMRIAGSPTPQS